MYIFFKQNLILDIHIVINLLKPNVGNIFHDCKIIMIKYVK